MLFGVHQWVRTWLHTPMNISILATPKLWPYSEEKCKYTEGLVKGKNQALEPGSSWTPCYDLEKNKHLG